MCGLHRSQRCSPRRRCSLLSRCCQVWHLLSRVTLYTGNKLELSSPGSGQLSQPPPCFCASQPHCNYSGLPIHKSTEQPKNKEGGKYLLSGFLPAHSACGNIHSSDGNLMDQTPPGTKSCFRTRHVSVSRREVIHCCPCWCPGEALAGVQALPAAGVHVGVRVQHPEPQGQLGRGEALPVGTRVEDLSLPSTTCCLHRGARLSKQLLLFTQNFCPGAAENEGQLSELPSAPLAQPACPSSDQDVPWQGYGADPVLKLCVHEVLTILEVI